MKFARRHLLLLMVAALLLAGLIYAFLPQPVQVDAASVVRGDMLLTVREDGVTRIRHPYVISAGLEGRLQRIDLKPGHPVERHVTVLATIEPPLPALLDASAHAKATAHLNLMREAKKRAEQHLQQERQRYEAAKARFERARDLLPLRGVSRDEFEKAEEAERFAWHELRKAEFSKEMAAFDLKMAEAAFERTRPRSPNEPHPDAYRILSPIDGKVLRVPHISERNVRVDTEIIEVGDPTDIEAVIDVLSADAVKIRPGQTVYFEHWGGDYPLEGVVTMVEPKGFMKRSALGVEEQRVNVIVDFVDPPSRRPTLFDEFRVEAQIVIWKGTNVLKVPAGALFRHGADWAVYVIENGRARRRLVTIGRNNGLEAEVLEHLAENEQVILHPGDKVTDSVKVAIRK